MSAPLKRDLSERDPLRASAAADPASAIRAMRPPEISIGAPSVGEARVGEDHPRHFISRHAISRTRRAATSL